MLSPLMCSETLSSAPALLSVADAALLPSLPRIEHSELAEQATWGYSAFSGSAFGLKEWFLPICEQKPWQSFLLHWTTGFMGTCDSHKCLPPLPPSFSDLHS